MKIYKCTKPDLSPSSEKVCVLWFRIIFFFKPQKRWKEQFLIQCNWCMFFCEFCIIFCFCLWMCTKPDLSPGSERFCTWFRTIFLQTTNKMKWTVNNWIQLIYVPLWNLCLWMCMKPILSPSSEKVYIQNFFALGCDF